MMLRETTVRSCPKAGSNKTTSLGSIFSNMEDVRSDVLQNRPPGMTARSSVPDNQTWSAPMLHRERDQSCPQAGPRKTILSDLSFQNWNLPVPTLMRATEENYETLPYPRSYLEESQHDTTSSTFIFLSSLDDILRHFSSQISSGQPGAREPPMVVPSSLSLLEGRPSVVLALVTLDCIKLLIKDLR